MYTNLVFSSISSFCFGVTVLWQVKGRLMGGVVVLRVTLVLQVNEEVLYFLMELKLVLLDQLLGVL